jgi:L-ribulokinase
MQVVVEDYELYKKTSNYLEGTDWVVSQLTGNIIRNNCTLGYKAMYHHTEGFPSKEFFKALDSRMENVIDEKIKGEIKNIGESAGTLTLQWATDLGLNSDVEVAVGNVDAHVSAPAVGAVNLGDMLLIMGTSTCDILISDEEKEVAGMCGVVYNGVMPGYFGYESGQSAVGDIFAWFTDNYINKGLQDEAKKNGISVHGLLEARAAKLRVGQSGLLALDWFGGNRSILVDSDLQGVILGMTLQTKPEEIYRALIESTAFGKKVIFESFEKSGVSIARLCVCGGLANKNEMLLQIYADVLDMEIYIADSEQTPALGSAMFASVAAKNRGGYPSILDASKFMARVKKKTVKPIRENVTIYKELYSEFKTLHDYFGLSNTVMKKLKKLK